MRIISLPICAHTASPLVQPREVQTTSTEHLHLLLFLLLITSLYSFLEITPTAYSLISSLLPVLLVVSLPLALFYLRFLFPPFAALLSHLCIHLFLLTQFRLHQHFYRLFPPFHSEFVSLQLFGVERVLVFSDQDATGVRDAVVQMFPLLLVKERGLGFLQAIERFWGLRVFRLVGMYE